MDIAVPMISATGEPGVLGYAGGADVLVVLHRADLDYGSPQFQPVLDHWEEHRMQPVWHGTQDGLKVLVSASVDYPEMLAEMRSAIDGWPTEASFRFRDLLWLALGREKP